MKTFQLLLVLFQSFFFKLKYFLIKDDRFLNTSEDDLYIDTYLNNDELFRAFDFIELMWHKVFEVIRFYMDLGMDSFESKLKL